MHDMEAKSRLILFYTTAEVLVDYVTATCQQSDTQSILCIYIWGNSLLNIVSLRINFASLLKAEEQQT